MGGGREVVAWGIEERGSGGWCECGERAERGGGGAERGRGRMAKDAGWGRGGRVAGDERDALDRLESTIDGRGLSVEELVLAGSEQKRGQDSDEGEYMRPQARATPRSSLLSYQACIRATSYFRRVVGCYFDLVSFRACSLSRRRDRKLTLSLWRPQHV